MKFSTRHIARAAAVAALYAALTLALRPLAFGPLQLRVSEALTCLPMLLPEAAAGLAVGCFVANLLGSEYGPLDMIFGPLATLAAALLTYVMRRKLKWHPAVCMLPPVLVNAVVVGIILHVTQGLPLWLTMAEVGIGQTAACYALGLPLYYLLNRLNPSLLRG